jgi:uncharacterized membrane protein
VTENSRDLGLERLIFFSDAVFAIAVTLLALDIKLAPIAPQSVQQELTPGILHLLSRLLIYAFSFLVVGSLWYGHHRMFQFIRRYDGRTIVLNLFFLMFVAAVPIPTRILGEYFNERPAVIFYASFLGITSLIQGVLWTYSIRRASLGESLPHARYGTRRSYIGPAVFALSIPLAFLSVRLAEFSWPLIWIIQWADYRITFSRHGKARP